MRFLRRTADYSLLEKKRSKDIKGEFHVVPKINRISVKMEGAYRKNEPISKLYKNIGLLTDKKKPRKVVKNIDEWDTNVLDQNKPPLTYNRSAL